MGNATPEVLGQAAWKGIGSRRGEARAAAGLAQPHQPTPAWIDTHANLMDNVVEEKVQESRADPREVNLKNWKREGYPSEYAYAMATGALNVKDSGSQPAEPIKPMPSMPSPKKRLAPTEDTAPGVAI